MHRIAQKYKQFCNNTSITYVDLVQEGTIGLIIARGKFRPNKGARFSTYANYWIRAKILRLLDRHYSTIHVTYSASAEYNRLIKKYGSINGIRGALAHTTEELIDKVTVEYHKGKISENDYKKFVDILQARSPFNWTHLSLDGPSPLNEYHGHGGSPGSSGDSAHNQMDTSKLGADIAKRFQSVSSIDDILTRESTIMKIMDILTEEEAKLIKLYHGLDGNREHTYKEIAVIFKCSKQKAHQWHQRIIKKLREHLVSLCVKDNISQKELLSDN